jgi:phospholipase/carboxylesterase
VDLTYLTHGPTRAEEKPPLLVFLHGVGADERDLLPLAAHLDPRLLCVSLRAPHAYPVMGYSWFDIDWSTSPPTSDLAQAEESRAAVAALLPELSRRHGTDPARTFLLGFSQGGALALAVALTRPDLVRAVVVHSGRLLPDLAARAAPREALARLDALVLHGVDDPVLPVERGRELRDFLEPLLGARMRYAEHEAGHEITPASFDEVARWLRARIGGAPPYSSPRPRSSSA